MVFELFDVHVNKLIDKKYKMKISDSIHHLWEMVIVVFPRKVLDYHRVSSFVAETRSSLHEEQVAILPIMSQEIVLMLLIHILQLNICCLDLF